MRSLRATCTLALLAPIALLASGVPASPAAAHGPAAKLPRGQELHQHGYSSARRHLGAMRRAARRRPRVHAAAAAGGLPTRWCGAPQQGDLPSAPGQAGAAAIKVIYAHPADLPARGGYFADLLQANASRMARFLAAQSGQRKTLRFDMGSTCGADYLDIQTVALRRTRAEYLYESGGVRYPYAGQAELHAEIQAAISGQTPYTSGYSAPVRNFLVFVDGINVRLDRQADGSWRATHNNWDWGAATTYEDESPDPYSQRNVNPYGQVATIFGSAPESQRDGRPVADPAAGFMPAEHLHEVLHTLGAVQNGAPNATGWLHCTDGQDVMCYRDSSDARSAQRAVCPALPDPLFSQSVDCGRNDYFDPAPAAGSYLDTRWNTFDSPFLGSCRELPRACGGDDRSTAADQVGFDSARANAIWRGSYGGDDAGAGIRVSVPRRQRVARRGAVVARVRCRSACTVSAPRRTALRVAGRSARTRRVSRALAAGRRSNVRLRLTRSGLRTLRRRLGRGRRPLLRVTFEVRDTSGIRRRFTRRVRPVR